MIWIIQHYCVPKVGQCRLCDKRRTVPICNKGAFRSPAGVWRTLPTFRDNAELQRWKAISFQFLLLLSFAYLSISKSFNISKLSRSLSDEVLDVGVGIPSQSPWNGSSANPASFLQFFSASHAKFYCFSLCHIVFISYFCILIVDWAFCDTP